MQCVLRSYFYGTGKAILSTLLTCVLLAAVPSNADALDAHYVKTLRESGVEPDVNGLREYLVALRPTPDARRRLVLLVQQLGDDDFFRREAAMRQLLRMSVCCPDVVRQAAESNDPEVRWRARQVLKLSPPSRTERVLFAAFTVVRDRHLRGLTRPVVEALPVAESSHVVRMGRLAAVASVTAADLPWLREQMRDADVSVATVAVSALSRLRGAKSAADLRPLLKRPEEALRLAAARALLTHGHRDALPALVKLLDADSLSVRTQAARTLLAATGQQFHFTAYDPAKSRQASVADWRKWVAEHGETAKLVLPLCDGEAELGRTLICYYSQKQIVEVDETGRETWKKTGLKHGPWDCDITPSGNRVVCTDRGRTIHEYDDKGKEVWTVENTPGHANRVQRLDNGNTLVTCNNTDKVVEYRPDKTIAWQVTLKGYPLDAQRLDNGNTLVTLFAARKVVEVDRDGKVVWRLETRTAQYLAPCAAQRLPNGHTLVTEYRDDKGRVAEFDRDKQLVWIHDNGTNPLDAQRLANGNTLVSYRDVVDEIDPEGRIVWSKRLQGAGRAYRY